MAMTLTGFPDSISPALKSIFENDFEKKIPYRANMYQMSKTTQQVVRVTSGGAFREVPKYTGVVQQDTPFEGYGRSIVQEEYAMYFSVQRALQLTQQLPIVKIELKEFSSAVADTLEHHAMKVFNFAFDTGAENLLGDGQPLVAAAHPNKDGSPAQDNRIGNAAGVVVSHGAIKALHAQAQQLKNDRGRPERAYIDGLVFNPAKTVEFMESINSTDDPATPSRNTNILNGNLFERIEGYDQKRMKLFSTPLLDNPNWWFGVNTRLMKMMLAWYTIQEPVFEKATEMSTLELRHQVYMYHGNGPRGWRWIWGSQAAS